MIQRIALLLAVLILVLAGTGAGHAAQAAPPQAAPPQAPQAVPRQSASAPRKAPQAPRGPADLILHKGAGRMLEIKQPVGSVIVGDQKVVDAKVVAPQMIYLFGAGIGRTDLTVVTQDDQVAASMMVAVTPDARGAEERLRGNRPDSALRFEISGNRLVLRGDAADVGEASAAQRLLEDAADADHRTNEAAYRGARQVTLKVRFAEVSRNEVNNLGFDWSALFSLGKTSLGLATGTAVGQALGTATKATSLTPFATPTVGILSKRVNANLVIEALESRGVVHTIAEPNLTVRSGKTARFRAGGDVPIPVPQQQGALSVQYRPFGISLEFTPVLLGGNRIAVHVKPEVSEISAENAVSFSGASIPSFTTREVETDVELGAGQTFAIAGLFQRNISKTRDTLPGLSDIPILNTLLASQHYQRGETELVVLITPHLVEPMDTAPPTPVEKASAAAQAQAAALADGIGFLVE
jgi:pilus assembly protein CpaC